MSGIYIPGMEMPKSCGDCPYRKRLNPDENECMVDHHVYEETLGRLMSRRDENCPLIPVPNHGRLIDESKFAYYAEWIRDPTGRTEKVVQWKHIIKSPTIIPADKEERQ